MERQKSRDKEIELLLNALENNQDLPEDVQSIDLTTDVADFINTFNIKEGTNRLPMSSFYVHYSKWSPEPTSYANFTIMIKKIFQTEKKRGILYVPIKNDLINLNNEIIKIKKEKNHLKKAAAYRKHIESFINEMDLTEDERWVDLETVYKWYIRWRYKRKTIKLTRSDIKNLLKFYFISKIGKKRAFFKLKGEFNMEKINQLRGNNGQEKTNKEVKGEIPST